MAQHLLPMAAVGSAYQPRLPPLFRPSRIVLTKGSLSTLRRRSFVEHICALYPKAQVIEQLAVPHNKISFAVTHQSELHASGRRTLVFGEHGSALGRSEERGNTCPNFWHFSPYGFCPYACQYCYLAGSRGVRFSPTVKIFVNLDEILDDIDRLARRIGGPEAFYLGKLQDGMALDPLTGYSRTMIPFFAQHPFARLRILSKCDDFENVLDLDHRGHTVLCWSLNPTAVRSGYEAMTPPIASRIAAIKRCAAAGYPVRVMLMPIIPIENWRQHYDALLEELLSQVRLDRLTLGGICSYGSALNLSKQRLGSDDPITQSLFVLNNTPQDGRARYALEDRRSIYAHLLTTIRRCQPELPCSLCMEDVELAQSLGLSENVGRCNCVL